MRIIAGTKKGLKLTVVKNRIIRPTADSTKELIFNVISDFIKNCVVLDIYAGSGSLGIEALSRGAVRAIFIENNPYALKILLNNLQKSGFVNSSEIFKISAQTALKKCSENNLKFDLIFADPPYKKSLAQDTITAVDRFNLLAKGGWLIVEHEDKTKFLNSTAHLTLVIQKRQGDSGVSFYQYV
ncbi:MAG: 16S rRNA (guanine(966)-N(2))-methyltransferase RsmD [bacterium]